MISVVQNFICTKSERLDVISRNSLKLGETFPNVDFFVNYNSDNKNYKVVRDCYLKNIPKLSFYNDLTKDWVLIALSMLQEIKTPYILNYAEDFECNMTKEYWKVL